jgi:hypothetical protein
MRHNAIFIFSVLLGQNGAMDHESAPATLHYFGFPETSANVHFVRHDPPARSRRAVLALVVCWALAAVTILVPIAHFVLVPGFFVAGIVLFVRRLAEGSTIVGVQGVCPYCKEERSFGAHGLMKSRFSVGCPVCHNQLDASVLAGTAP